jgi:F-type H+-transporting ATPase subunit delta
MPTTTGGQSIAYAYAEALYDVASEGGNVVSVEAELQAIDKALSAEPRLRLFLETPTVPFEDKRKVLTSALSGISKPVLNTLCLAIEHGRISLFDAMVHAFHRHANEKAGVAEVNVISARQLDARELENLSAVLQKKLNQKIKLVESVRPELLGGIVVTHNDRNWDASVSHRLERIVNKIEEVKTLAPVVNS